ncbi:NmrA family NAD(P)-binding protein [Tessaracoccus sp. MC1756]|uniref:NmrA family NAD(P)-binding protein n=1 Tax=Tessaracoccus sp. MC1756 TaxID=2760311 RepID=UPI00160240FA|nr:NmrA family NAD(P)-binding protein [Tessaracoccus sp. MC1756]MBB1509576.1 NmrA family NAD(P)-binding protein [Tessaracoccus sp. MC1756]
MTTEASPPADRTVLVTGATGYIGGLLTQRLLDEGWRVRVLTRHKKGIGQQSWGQRVEVIEGDADSADDLATAFEGVQTAYYLIHSMGQADDFAARDRALAQTFGDAAAQAGVRRIVYLSGLHPDGELSPHLASRVEVGDILMASGVPTAVIQAAVVVGNGSVSFDMLRYLAERLPVMVAPKWLNNRIQPIAIDDVLHYLVGAADLPDDVNRTFDVGGPEVLTYADMLQRFSAVTGLRRRLIMTVPVLTPHLASQWIGLVTPLDVGVAKPLIGSLVHEVFCRENDIDRYIPAPAGGPTGFDDAVRAAMAEAPPDHALRHVATVAAALAVLAAVAFLAMRN